MPIAEVHVQLKQSWAAFSRSADKQEYLQNWLEILCLRTPGLASAGVLLMQPEAKPIAITWPADDASIASHLNKLAETVVSEDRGLMQPAGPDYLLALPIRVGASIVGVLVVSARVEESELAAAMEHLQWSASWVELLVRREAAGISDLRSQSLQEAIDVFAVTLEQDQFHAAAMALVNDLVVRYDADRVSFGVASRGQSSVEAVSHTADFAKASTELKSLELLMDEAIYQRHPILLSGSNNPSNVVMREHLRHQREYGGQSILTVPVHDNEAYVGAIVLERSSNVTFSLDDSRRLESTFALLAPALQRMRDQDKPWVRKAADGLQNNLGRLVGPQHVKIKFIAFVVSLFILASFIFKGDYRVIADSALEGSVRQVISAPFAGYLASVNSRPGDLVQKGQELCALEDKDLVLEKLAGAAEYSKLIKQYEEATGSGQRAQSNVLRAQLAQSKASLELVESRIARTKLKAPISGMITEGDLSQRVGAAVNQGEKLFEVSSIDNYRVVIWVDEHVINDVVPQQVGRLVLTAFPGQILRFTVDKITPITRSEEGINAFRVEAVLDNPNDMLRPGMKGKAKVFVEERAYISIWVRPVINWFRLALWRWSF
jgi:biotin carboxyl carrier protein